MKRFLLFLAYFYVLLVLFLGTDLNPLLMWDPYRVALNAALDAYPRLCLLFIMGGFMTAMVLSHHEEKNPTGAHKGKLTTD